MICLDSLACGPWGGLHTSVFLCGDFSFLGFVVGIEGVVISLCTRWNSVCWLRPKASRRDALMIVFPLFFGTVGVFHSLRREALR